MISRSSLLLCVGVGVALLPAAVLFERGEPAGYAPDFWDASQAQGVLDHERRRYSELERQRAAMLQLIAMKQEAVNELVARRITLAEAAERFRAAEALRLPLMAGGLADMPGDDEEEKLYRHVISYVGYALDRDPARRNAEVARLEKDFQALRGRPAHAPVMLPPRGYPPMPDQ